jgi:DNA-directed RNA polymerase specialized sigma24 family protein
VARNLHVSYCRTRAIERAEGDVSWLWPAPVAATPFEEAAGSELEQRIRRGLADLPVSYREAL